MLLWLGAGVSCGRHVVDGGGDTVLALVAELLAEVFSEVVVVGFESGDSSRAVSSRCRSDSVDPRSGDGMWTAWVVVTRRSRLISARRSGWW